MRRLLLLAAVLLSASACGDRILGPVQTVDGTWSGTHSGYAITFVLSQSDSTVFGSATISGVGGAADLTVTGTFKYPNLDIIMDAPNVTAPAEYTATMSATQAVLNGHLNGGGFNNLAFSVNKQ